MTGQYLKVFEDFFLGWILCTVTSVRMLPVPESGISHCFYFAAQQIRFFLNQRYFNIDLIILSETKGKPDRHKNQPFKNFGNGYQNIFNGVIPWNHCIPGFINTSICFTSPLLLKIEVLIV